MVLLAKVMLQKITFSYPDGPRDAEALIAGPGFQRHFYHFKRSTEYQYLPIGFSRNRLKKRLLPKKQVPCRV
jgi:hypothetical protein